MAMNFAATLDGRATIGGVSGPIGSETDTAMLVRAAHALRRGDDRRRDETGRALRRPRQAAGRGAAATRASWPTSPHCSRSLREEGVRAVICEGGPTLHGSLQAEGLVDELFLTIAPKLSGGQAPRILEGTLPGWSAWSWSGCWRRTASSSPATGGPEAAIKYRSSSGRDEERNRWTSTPAPRSQSCASACSTSWTTEIYPQEREIMEALDAEVATGVPYPQNLVAVREKAKARGPLEPLHARRALRAGAEELGVRAALRGDGPQPDGGADGLQLLGPGHRQHGDPRRARDARAARALARAAAGGQDPLLLLDDRARGLRLGPDAAAGAAPSSTATSGSSTATSGSPAAPSAPTWRSRWSSPTPTPPPTPAPR